LQLSRVSNVHPKKRLVVIFILNLLCLQAILLSSNRDASSDFFYSLF